VEWGGGGKPLSSPTVERWLRVEVSLSAAPLTADLPLDTGGSDLLARGVSIPSADFYLYARLASPDDNVAVAIQRIEAGTRLAREGQLWVLSHTVLEGHRFAVLPIAVGETLRSWGLPFGRATLAIAPGEYVCNPSMLEALKVRSVELCLPETANFADSIEPFVLDEPAFKAALPTEQAANPRTFSGFARPGSRGVGTRNTVVILGTTSRTAAVARQLAARLQPLARLFPGIDGIVAIAHTEGGGPDAPNNTREVLRALAGFMVHPNVGAVLALDFGVEPITNRHLQTYLREAGYPLTDVLHEFLTLRGPLTGSMAEAERIVRSWLPAVNAFERSEQPVAALRIALQCGGSDAFSGISGNPLAGAVVHEVIRHGGAASLCETDEIVGAESYVLRKVRDLPTARALLATIEAFKERLSWHGLTPESNPSAGNKLRGLYNIVLKSLGAAHKKDPRTRIDHVIAYGEPIRHPGFHFMDSPGNDLEGIAGQVASGCNLFLFVTGNGSITNFPFVPTLKITTTTRRHQLLVHEMDVNAGRYLDGESMEKLAAETFELVLATASGRRTQGEHAGHSQVSLWRNWRQTDASQLPAILARRAPDGEPLYGQEGARSLRRIAGERPCQPLWAHVNDDGRCATERIGLVLPTSLCSTQVARMAAERLNASGLGRSSGITRFAALVHTEGCGFGGESMYRLLLRTYAGYATHPNVAATLLLEHGCEKVPNDIVKNHFVSAGISPDRFGWASVQLDGGIDQALGRVEAWFAQTMARLPAASAKQVDLGALTVGLMTAATVSASTVDTWAELANGIVAAGGSVLIPVSDALVARPEWRRRIIGDSDFRATLIYGQRPKNPGLHLVETESSDWLENLAGLGGCGAHLFATVVDTHARAGHPLVPVLQFAEAAERATIAGEDIDGFLGGVSLDDDLAQVIGKLVGVAGAVDQPVSARQGLQAFQLTRGLLGIST